jgi:serine/alanine adding enzyme
VIAEVAPADWNGLLERLGLVDVYLRREYVEASTLLEPGRPLFLHSDGGVFAGILRSDPTDVTTPYGYGGPVGADARFWDHYEEWCRANGVITTFLRFHPLYANHRDAGSNVRVERLGGTIAWRLDEPGDLFERMHRHHRRAVRKAVAAGVQASVTLGPESLASFVRLYEATMERRQAAGFYYFPPEYWRALESRPAAGDVGVHLHLHLHPPAQVVLFEAGDDAALLCLASPPWLHYHLGASSEAGRRLGASNLLFLEAARWAADLGYTRFHLGGGVGGAADSLYEFKRRFDPDGELEAAIGKAVHDKEAYRELASPHAGLDGFFPAYRAPAAGTPS